MGAAVPIIGAGISLVSGVSQHNQQRQQAESQRRMIENQAAADRLQSELALIQLNNQSQMNKLSDLNRTVLEGQAYVNRMNQIGLEEASANLQFGLAQAENTTSSLLSKAAEEKQKSDATIQSNQATTELANQLASAFGQITKDQGDAISARLQSMSPDERQRAFRALLDAGAAGAGTNETLNLLLENQTVTGGIEREVEVANRRRELATEGTNANQALVDASRESAISQAQLKGLQEQNQLGQQALDITASQAVNQAGFVSERLATNFAKSTSDSTSSVERLARDEQLRAQQYVIEQGGRLAQDTANAQLASVRSPGFIDALGVVGQTYNTYRGLGGNFSFMNRRQPTSVIRQGVDVTNSYGGYA